MDNIGGSHSFGTHSNSHIPPHILDDLCARFVINLPEEESRDPIRVFFQIEIAHWFYLDFYCPENSELRQCNIKEFSTQIFRHCPSLAKHLNKFDTLLESWKEYKMAVPTYGAILLDPSLQYCLLVQGYWVKASWGFPKGKVNQDESPLDCAIREVLEETGFDIQHLIDPDVYLESKLNEQISRLYIVPGVSMETKFKARTRNEIKSFEWFIVEHLPSHKKDIACKQNLGLNPNAFFMVIPFMKGLRRFINSKLGHPEMPFCDTGGLVTSSTSMCEIGVGSMASESSGRSGRQSTSKDAVPQAASYKEASYDSKMRQKADFARQMQLEFQEYIGHQEYKKAAAASNTRSGNSSEVSRSEAMSPRRTPSSSTPRKQFQILKRETVKSGKADQKVHTAHNLPDSVAEISTTGSTERINVNQSVAVASDFVKTTVWTNFRLDIDAIITAMFPPASHVNQSHQSGRGSQHSRAPPTVKLA